MELFGNLTTKELKKKHSSRLVGGVKMVSWGGDTRGKVAAGDQRRRRLVEQATPHLCADKPGGTTEE